MKMIVSVSILVLLYVLRLLLAGIQIHDCRQWISLLSKPSNNAI